MENMENINYFEDIPTVELDSTKKQEVNPFTEAAQFLHDNARIVEEGAGVELIKQVNIDQTHTRLDFARALRTAANFLDGTKQ